MDCSNHYLRQISKYPLLTRQEEAALAVRIRHGDRAALDRLVKANLRFVVSVARQYANRGMPLQDLIQQGNLGVLEAARKYDEKRNTRFISFAVWWIRHYMLTSMCRYSRCVVVPQNLPIVLRVTTRIRDRLEQARRRPVDAAEVAATAHTTVEHAQLYLEYERREQLSTSAALPDTNNLTVEDCLESEDPPPDAAVEEAQEAERIRRKLDYWLSDRERQIIECRYGFRGLCPKDLPGTARRMHRTRQAVSQAEQRAFSKLRPALGDK